VQLGYEAEGIRLIGPGAKTNFHYDPDDSGEPGIMARFFHVLRGTEGVKDVRMLTIEEAFQPLLTQTWSGLKVDPTSAKMAITSATFGLLALPADVPQTYAAPALVVEGRLEGVLAEDGRLVELRFGQYLPLANAKGLGAVTKPCRPQPVHGHGPATERRVRGAVRRVHDQGHPLDRPNTR